MESFDPTVYTPEWLAQAAAAGVYWARHHLVVNLDSFSKATLEAWLAKQVRQVHGETWQELAGRLSRVGFWEFKDYLP